MYPKSSPHITYFPPLKQLKNSSSKLGTRSKSKFRKYIDYPVQNSMDKFSHSFSLLPASIFNQIHKLERLTLQQIQKLQIQPPATEQLDFDRLKEAVLLSSKNLHLPSPKQKEYLEQEPTKNHNNLFDQEYLSNLHPLSDSLGPDIIEQQNMIRFDSDSSHGDISKRFKTENNILYFHEDSPLLD